MHTTRSMVLMALLAAGGLLAPASAGDEEAPPWRSRKLVRRVSESPIDLMSAVQRSELHKGTPLRAAFVRDQSGRLVVRILLRSAPQEKGTAKDGSTLKPRAPYEEWSGIVYDGCWTPRPRTLVEPGEVAEARRIDALYVQGGRTLAAAILRSRGPQRADKTTPGVALSIEPRLEDGKPRFVSWVALHKKVRRLTQDLDTGEILESRAAHYSPAPIHIDPTSLDDRLPELTVPEGSWFNTTTPPSLASGQGEPMLVSISDPG